MQVWKFDSSGYTIYRLFFAHSLIPVVIILGWWPPAIFFGKSVVSDYHVKILGVGTALKLEITSSREYISADNVECPFCVIRCYSANCGL